MTSPRDPDITAAEARRCLSYNSATGEFRWRLRPAQQVKTGDIAGSRHSRGYWHIKIAGKLVLAHRLAWLMTHGEWPKFHMDHINGNGLDNRITNLRPCTQTQNNQNRCRPQGKNNQYIGVSSYRGKWRARIRHNKILMHLGYFDTPEKAYDAYVKTKRKLHEFNTL